MTTAAPPVSTVRRPSLRFAGARAVFERDFLVFTSRGRFLLLRTLVVLLPAAILLAVFGTASVSRGSGSSSTLGQVVYSACVIIVPGLVLLLAPVLAASCISSERAMNTLQIVLASPVSPFAFVFAKFASRLCVVLVLAFATLPLAGLCFLFGGVSGGLFFEMVAFAAGIAVLGTAAGIIASSWSRSVAAATLSSYFLGIFLPILHLAFVAIVTARRQTGNAFEEGAWLLPANPFYAWGMIGLNAATGVGAKAAGWKFLGWAVGIAVAAVAFGAWRVGREAAQEVALRRGGHRATGLRWQNPVIDRGLRGSLLHRPRWKSWFGLAVILVVLCVMIGAGVASRDLGEAWPHVSFLCITSVLVCLTSITTASHSIAHERETGALDLLLATRMTTSEVVRGKFVAALLAVSPLVAVPLLYAVAATAVTKLQLFTVFAWFVTVCILVPFMTAFGLWCSATASTAGRAVMRAFAILLGGSIVHAVSSGIFMATADRLADKGVMWFIFGPSPFFIGGTPVVLSIERHHGNEEMYAFVSWTVWSGIYAVSTVLLLSATMKVVERRNDAR